MVPGMLIYRSIQQVLFGVKTVNTSGFYIIVHEDKLSPRSVLGNFGSASIPFKKKITDQEGRSDIIESQMYVIKKTVHEKLNTRAHPCVEDMEEAFDDCVEKHIERKIYCTIPWKKYAGDNG